MAILNYTTQIDCYKTITEIQKMLAKAGANKVVVDNDIAGNPVALTFCITWNQNISAFSLPCNFEGVLKSLRSNGKVPNSLKNEAQALRIGWRIIKDWIEAQLAIVEAQLATLPEIFLPYVVTKSGDTLYKLLDNDNRLLLT